MNFITKTAMTTALAASLLATDVKADWFGKGFGATKASSKHMPPNGYDSQWWVHPTGCEYSRAGRPGEIVWYVIINSIGKRNCPALIVQKAYADFQG